MTKLVSARTVYDQLGLNRAPTLIDVRHASDIERVPRMIPGAMHVESGLIQPWLRQRRHQAMTLYSSAEHDIGAVANVLSNSGLLVSVLQGGIEDWIRSDLPTIKVREDLGVPGRSQWVTRERPKIDRIACPWLIRRFIDPLATFHYVPAQRVRSDASLLGAQPYDIPDVMFSHRGPRCSFDAFLDEFELHDPILDELARIVRAADTRCRSRSWRRQCQQGSGPWHRSMQDQDRRRSTRRTLPPSACRVDKTAAPARAPASRWEDRSRPCLLPRFWCAHS
jgi:rhodanese-related sulfurtransferase